MYDIKKANKSEHHDIIIQAQMDMAWESEQMKLDKALVSKGVEAVFDDSSKGTYYAAFKDGEFAGCLLTTYEWSDWRNATILWIQSVWVPKSFRRQGVFREMYTHLKNMVEGDDSLCGLRLYVDKSNTPAQKVYTALGMDHEHYDMYEWIQD